MLFFTLLLKKSPAECPAGPAEPGGGVSRFRRRGATVARAPFAFCATMKLLENSKKVQNSGDETSLRILMKFTRTDREVIRNSE